MLSMALRPLLASSSLRKLRSSTSKVVWSRRQPLASVGAVLTLMDAPQGCDPAYSVVCFRFRMIRRYLAYRPSEVDRFIVCWIWLRRAAPGHGLTHFLASGAADVLGWARPGLLALSDLAGPNQHFRSADFSASQGKVAPDLCARSGFRCGPLLDVLGTLQHLNSCHVRQREKHCLGVCWLEEFGMVSFF